jgi:hypothetical protein
MRFPVVCHRFWPKSAIGCDLRIIFLIIKHLERDFSFSLSPD